MQNRDLSADLVEILENETSLSENVIEKVLCNFTFMGNDAEFLESLPVQVLMSGLSL